MTLNHLGNGASVLPDQIVLKLRLFIRRARRMILLRGGSATCAIALACFLAIMAIDAGVTLFAAWPRWALAVGAYAVIVISAGWFLARPLARSFTLAGAARLIETHHPELQERISSTVELLTSRDIPALRGSEVLIAALTEEAVRDAQVMQPKREVSLRPVVPYLGVAALLLVVLAGLLLAMPRQTSFLLARAAAPFLNLPNVYATDLAVAPGDTLVAEGSRLQINVSSRSPLVASARLRKLGADGRERADEMVLLSSTNAAERQFVFVLPKVDHGFRYRVHAGDALTRYYTVRVATPPVIGHLAIRTEYPEYSGIPPRRETDGAGDIRALAGSRVTVSAKVNKFVPSVQLRVVTGAGTNVVAGAQRTEGDAKFYDFPISMKPRLAGRWTIRLEDEFHLSNSPFEHSIQSVPDQAPWVKVMQISQKEIRLNRDDRLPVTYRAEDDVSLASVALALEVDGRRAPDRPLHAADEAAEPIRLVQDTTAISLSDALFTNAQRIVFQIKAADGLPATLSGPQTGQSEPYTIVIADNVPSWQAQMAASQEQNLRQGIEQARRELREARGNVQNVQEPLTREMQLSRGTVDQVDRAQGRLEQADAILKSLSRELSRGFYEKLATNLQEIADQHVESAASMAGQIKLADEPQKRTELATNTTGEIDTSLAALDQALKDVEPMTAALRRAVEMDNLAQREADLAAKKTAMEAAQPSAEEGRPEARVGMDDEQWRRAQERLAGEIGKMARQTPGTPQALAQLNREGAQQFRTEAEELARSQTNLLARMGKEAQEFGSVEQSLRDLAAEQEKLAQQTKDNLFTVEPFQPMARAAEEIRRDRLPEAVREQTAAEQSLRADAAKIRQSRSPRELAAQEPSPAEQAQQATRRATEAGRHAEEAAQSARQSTQQAQARAQKAEDLARQAERTASPELAREFGQQAQEARQDAEEAAQWARATTQAVEAVHLATQEAQRAAEPVAREQDPENARRMAREAAAHARRAEHEARRADAFAQRAALAAAEPRSPQQRAAEAAQRAREDVEAARRSSEDAHEASKAAQENAAAARQTAEAAQRAGNEERAREAQVEAREATRRAEEAAKSSEGAKREAKAAEHAAEQARRAAHEAAQPAAPHAAQTAAQKAQTAAQKAETAAKQTAEAAQRAAVYARAAQQNAAHPASPHAQAAHAAKQAEHAASKASESAHAAKASAQEAGKTAQRAAQTAEHAQRSGNQALAQAAQRQAQDAGQQSEHAGRSAKQAEQSAAQAQQAAQQARQASAQVAPSMPRAEQQALAQQAERAAQQAMKHAAAAEEAKRAADAAHASAKASSGAPKGGHAGSPKASAGKAAQSAAQAQRASQQAAQSAQAAQQAAQRAQQVAQQAQQQASQGQPHAGQPRAGQPHAGAPHAAQAQQAAKAAQGHAAAAQQAAQHAGAAAQQAQQQAQQAAAAQTPQAAEQAAMEAAQSGQAAEQAAREAGEAARQAQESGVAAAGPQQAEQMDRMAGEQAALRRRTEEILAKQSETAERFRNDAAPLVRARQSELAEEASKLAGEVERALPPRSALAATAARSARDAAERLSRPDFPAAAHAAASAADRMGELAQHLGREALRAQGSAEPSEPRAPALGNLAARTGDLGRRQQALQRQMAALAKARPIEQMAGAQEGVAGEVSRLAEQANLLRDMANDMGMEQPIAQPAQSAAGQMEQAQRAAQRAAEQLAQAAQAPSQAGEPLAQTAQSAQPAQQSAAQALTQAAQAMQNLASALAAQPAPPTAAPPHGQSMASAYQHTAEAARRQQAGQAVQAAQSLAQAANQAAQQARAMGVNARPREPQMMMAAGRGINPDEPTLGYSPGLLARLGLKLRDWLRLPGELRDEVLQGAGAAGPEEYRPIIKRYFEEVARRGGIEE